METDRQIPRLFQFLFGEAAETAERGASDRLRRWSSAFEAWLEERERLCHPITAHNLLIAWRTLLGVQRKLPYELARADIEAHRDWLQAHGFAPGTIRNRLVYISSFYRWCGETPNVKRASPR
jgi:hypothetical protein